MFDDDDISTNDCRVEKRDLVGRHMTLSTDYGDIVIALITI